MENIAHSLCGYVVSRLGFAGLDFRDSVGRRAGLIGILAANLPDADVVLYAAGTDFGNWHHRGLTHSFFGWPFLAIGAAAISRRLTGTGRYRDHLALWTLGLLSHVVLDWPTTWGAQLLWPLSTTRFHLDCIFIVDPMFWVILGLLPLLLRRAGFVGTTAAGMSLGALLSWMAIGLMGQELARDRVPVTRTSGPPTVLPGPFAPLQWTAVQREGDRVQRYWVSPRAVEDGGTFEAIDAALREGLQQTEAGRRYLWLSRAPAIRERSKREDGEDIVILDLAYGSWMSPDVERFSKRVRVSPDGAVEVLD